MAWPHRTLLQRLRCFELALPAVECTKVPEGGGDGWTVDFSCLVPATVLAVRRVIFPALSIVLETIRVGPKLSLVGPSEDLQESNVQRRGYWKVARMQAFQRRETRRMGRGRVRRSFRVAGTPACRLLESRSSFVEVSVRCNLPVCKEFPRPCTSLALSTPKPERKQIPIYNACVYCTMVYIVVMILFNTLSRICLGCFPCSRSRSSSSFFVIVPILFVLAVVVEATSSL